MKNLALDSIRGFVKKITQFVGFIFFIIASILTFTALFSSVFQVRNGINKLKEYSGTYDYEINTSRLSIDNNVYNNNNNKINFYNRKFLEQFYEPSKIDKFKLTFDNVKTDLVNFKCMKNDKRCWLSNSYINGQGGIDSFNSVIKNFNGILEAAFLSYIVSNLQQNNENKVGDSIPSKLDLCFSLNYLFTARNVGNVNQYFNVTSVSKNFKSIFNINNQVSWKNNTIFSSRFNNVINAKTYNKINFIDRGTIYLSRQYCDYNKLNNDNQFNISTLAQKLLFKIKGWGTRYSDIYPNLATMATIAHNKGNNNINFKKGALLYVNNDDYRKIKANYIYGEELLMAYLKVNGDFLKSEKSKYVSDVLNKHFVSVDDSIVDLNSSFSGQIIMLTNTAFIIDVSVALACSIIIGIITIFFVRRDVESQKRQIGILKSLGYHRYQLALVFTFNVIFTIFISCVIGWLLSIPLQIYFTSSNLYSIGLSLSSFYFNVIILISVVIFIPLIFIVLAFIISFVLVNRSAIDLIYNFKLRNFVFKNKLKLFSKVRKLYYLCFGFKFRLSFSFVLRSFEKWIMIMIIFMFVSFLLVFQLDAGLMAEEIANNSFHYFKDEVKSYLLTNYNQEDLYNQNLEIKTYDWITLEQAQREKYYKALILSDGKIFSFPNPIACLFNLNNESLYSCAKQYCGDFLNIVGNPADDIPKSKISKRIDDGKYPYLDSYTVQSIINYKIIDNQGNEINGWDNAINLLNNHLIKKYLDSNGINSDKIQNLKNIIIMIKTFGTLTDNLFPDIYLGPYMVYDPKYDFPYTQKSARWNSNDFKNANNPISSISIVGFTSDQKVRENYFNFKSYEIGLREIQEQVFNYTISDSEHPLFFNKIRTINEPIPAILSKRIMCSTRLKKNDYLIFDVRVTNSIGYVPVIFKVVGYNEADISSANIYVNENSLIKIMNIWVRRKGVGVELPNNEILNYHNAMATRIDDRNNSLQPNRIVSVYSLINEYDFTILKKDSIFPNKKNIDTKKIQSLRKNIKMINNINKIWPFDSLRKTYESKMTVINDVLKVLEMLTILIVTLVLLVLVNMVLEENKRTILTMKALGYEIWKIVLIVLGFYLFSAILGYVLSFVVSTLLWNIIIELFFEKTGMLLGLPFSMSVILITALVVSSALLAAFVLGIWKIKKDKLTHISF